MILLKNAVGVSKKALDDLITLCNAAIKRYGEATYESDTYATIKKKYDESRRDGFAMKEKIGLLGNYQNITCYDSSSMQCFEKNHWNLAVLIIIAVACLFGAFILGCCSNKMCSKPKVVIKKEFIKEVNQPLLNNNDNINETNNRAPRKKEQNSSNMTKNRGKNIIIDSDCFKKGNVEKLKKQFENSRNN